MIDFTDQVAIVTGSGRGLGRMYALELARRGAAVVVNDIGSTMQGDGADAGVADAVVAEIEGAGGLAVASHHSVSTAAGGEAIVQTALDRFGRVDVVVNNAGILLPGAIDDVEGEDWRRMLNVHLDGSFHVSQPAFPAMKSQGYGRFVFITSSLGIFGGGPPHYGSAKAGIAGLSNNVAIAGAAHGIRSNCVLPFGHSRMVTGDADTDTDRDRGPLAGGATFVDAIEAELVVPMVVFLASRDCDFTHRMYSACAGRFARVFIALGRGWLSEAGSAPTADDIAVHIDEVSAVEPYIIPESIADEILEVCERRGVSISG
jgi:NAD(P)-dependent dehydrogenase (short-subunit alcohol dehydrogenase family)